MAAFSESKVFGMTVRESADDGSDFSNPDADYRVLFLGEDGDLHLKDSAGAVTTPNDTGGGGGLDSGTSFPGGPSTDDLFFRTDRGLIYYYDGTRWLTTNEYALPMSTLDANWPVTTTQNGDGYAAVDEGANGAWITRLVAFTLVIGTNDGSNFWTVQIHSKSPAGTDHNIGSTFSTSADTAGQSTKHVVTVGAAVTSGDARYQSTLTKTASASGIYMASTVYYRLIG